jgi:acyl-CoA thioester hydrolase
MKKAYSLPITVQPEHLDELNHVNNVVWVQWVQDVAKAHWFSLTDDPLNRAFFWVVVKHEIEYKKPAFLGEQILATTYVEEFRGPLSVRVVEFRRADALLVRARSTWCFVDAEKQKPAKVMEDIVEMFI